jgi:hypothetical protein
VSVSADLDAPRAAREDGFSDAVTLAFADPRADVYGTIRLGLADGNAASGLVVLFQGGEIATVAAEGGVAVEDGSAWEHVQAAGIDIETIEPLRAWRLSFAGQDGSLDLEIEAPGPACALDAGDPVARVGGMLGFEQPVRVRGTANLKGEHVAIDGVGQRSRSWGSPDWSRIGRTRTVSAWFGDESLSVSAIAANGESDHGREAISATIFEPGETGFVHVEDPRLSTTFDADGRQRRAALELWVTDDGPPRRATGDVVCGTTLDLGRLRLDTAFLSWRMDDRVGAGRYDVLRRADD